MKEYVAKIIFETNSANLKVDQTNKKVKDLGKTTNQVSKTGAKGFKDLGGAMNMLPGPIGRVVTSFQTLKVAMISSGIGAIVVAAGALGALFVTAAKKGAEFSKAMSGLKAVAGATDEEMKALSQSAKDLGSSTAFTATQVAELQTEYAKLGKSTPEILAATEATLNLAAALDVGLADAATLAGSTINAFGLQAEDTRRVADVLAASTTNAGLEFSTLVESLKVAAPAARGTGVALEDTVAMLGVLADNSIKGSRAGTGLSRMLSELRKQGITLQEAFDKVNSSTDGYITASELAKENGGKVLFTLSQNTEALGLLKSELNGASEAFDGLGAAAFVAETRLDNLDGDITKLESAWEGFLLNIEDGEGILNKGARVVVKYFTGVVGAWTDITQFASAVINENIATVKRNGKFLVDFVQFIAGSLALKLEIAFIKIKESVADVPILGKGINKQELQKRRKEIADEFDILRKNVKQSAEAFKDGENGLNMFQRIMKRYFDMKKGQQLPVQEKEIENNEVIEEQEEEQKKRITDLIKIQEELLKQAKLMSGATEKDIALRNDRIATINEEIKRLKALRGIKYDIERIDTENMPKIEARGAKRVEIEHDVTQQARLGTVERVRNFEIERQAEDEMQRLKYDSVFTTLSAISTLTNAFAGESEKQQKRAFKINKAASIAETLIKTYQSAQGAYNSQVVIPSPDAPVRAAIAAAIATAAGLANVAAIASQKFQGGGSQSPSPAGGGLGAGAGIGSQAPQFNIVGQSGFNQIASAIGQQPPVQAFVVAQDVTTAQQLQNNTIQTATF
tara:strand:+ start:18723 stop:21119 length:2397 start_codon:yes stop_codon:yes gene_type:complete